MKAISLGWGVQSFTLVAMSALGEIEQVDAAIHADTTFERADTYKFAKRWIPWLEDRGVRVVTVQEKATDIELGAGGVVDIPAFTVGNGIYGQIRRQCTAGWKIAPIRRWLQAHRNGEPVELWLGISLDEAMRMRHANVKYITHRWPLIEKCMSRYDCKLWLEAHGLEIPISSSCTFCPFHDRATWRDMKLNHKKDWQQAIEIDYEIRKARPPYDLFLHAERIPLEKVDLRNLEDHGQLKLWDEECSGVCGV